MQKCKRVLSNLWSFDGNRVACRPRAVRCGHCSRSLPLGWSWRLGSALSSQLALSSLAADLPERAEDGAEPRGHNESHTAGVVSTPLLSTRRRNGLTRPLARREDSKQHIAHVKTEARSRQRCAEPFRARI